MGKPVAVEKIEYDAAYLNSLKFLGFDRIPSVANLTTVEFRKKYKEQYGVGFIGDAEMDFLTTKNGFTWAISNEYRGEIPKDAGTTLIANYSKVSKIKHYIFVAGEWHVVDGKKFCDVYVVAPKEMFNDGATLHSGSDPIAVIKVDGGWLELSRWK
jgi:hypothetical protein